jgi:lipopolysaccharide export system protein LptA
MRRSNSNLFWLVCSLALPQLATAVESPSEEAARMFRQANESAAVERGLQQENGARDERTQRLFAQARANQGKVAVDPGEQAKLDEASLRLKEAMSNASPEGKILLAQNNASPAQKPSLADKVVPAHEVTISDVASAKPEPLRPTSLEPAKKDADRTVINCSGAAFFDSKEAIGVFSDDVVVQNPQFNINCDTLEVFMKKEDAKKEPAAPAPGALPGEKPPGNGMADSGVERAIAKGRKVIIQKLNATGQLQIGICRHATYEGSTGDIILRDFPQVQDGGRVVTATDRTTVITLKQNGEFETKGPHRTELSKTQPAPQAANANP